MEVLFVLIVFDEKIVEFCRIEKDMIFFQRFTFIFKKNGKIVVNTQQIDPMPVITGATKYPDNIVQKMQDGGFTVDSLDCLSLAKQAGTEKAVNVVLLGRLSKYLDFSPEMWISALEKQVKPQFFEMNKKAFALGRE